MNEKTTTYLGNQNLKRTGVRHNYSKEQIDEFLKCESDIDYFVGKYIKIVTIDKGLIQFNPYEYQKRIINVVENNRLTICKLPRQSGKALDIETDILTNNGFKKLKEINIGDIIFGPDGKQTTVTFITEIMENHECYKITFDNEDTIIADAEHLWEVGSSNWAKNKRKILTTKELLPFINHTNKPFIDFTKSIDFEEKQLKIDPYLLGTWFGNGNSTSLGIVNSFDNNHIPNEYIFNSKEQRISLVQGLMDTNGIVNKQNGSCKFHHENENLIDQFRFLLSSLGIKSRKRKVSIDEDLQWAVSFIPNIFVFRLKEKRSYQKLASHKKTERIYFKKIEIVDSVPVRCLQVNNNSHLFLAGNTLIPTHNTSIVAAILLHYILFNKNYSIAILAHKHTQAREILARMKLAYEWLPKWLQQGIVEWNKGSVKLENGSRVVTSATTNSAIRGDTFNLIYLDEFAFVPSNMQEEFFASVYPTISSGDTSKVVITSTPNGLNMFYKLWTDSEEGNNSYKRIEVQWYNIPGRDEKWKEETIKNTSERQFRQEFECEFLGSSNTLINPSKLRQLAIKIPIEDNGSTKIYMHPEKNRQYLMTVDTARGLGLDFSAYIIFDVTEIPYRIAVVYRDAEISPLILPNILHQMSMHYNNCPVLIETNDIGQQVADILYHDLEYDNLVFATSNDRDGQFISTGFSGQKMHYGVRMTKQVKRIGCSNFKNIVENDKIIITDYSLIYELSRFISHRTSFEADEGCNDDLVMCCVIFSWMVNQNSFKDIGKIDIRAEILKQNMNIVEDQLLSFGFTDGVNEDFMEDENDPNRKYWSLD